jgi:hypothetical protein
VPVTATVLEKVRQAVEEAAANGLPVPGRPTLIRLIGATDHQVRQALAMLVKPGDAMPPVGAQPSEMQLAFEPNFGGDKAVFVGQA